MKAAKFNTEDSDAEEDTKSINKMISLPIGKLGTTLVTVLVIAICGWMVNAVRLHDTQLETHKIQIETMVRAIDEVKATFKEGFKDIKDELRSNRDELRKKQ